MYTFVPLIYLKGWVKFLTQDKIFTGKCIVTLRKYEWKCCKLQYTVDYFVSLAVSVIFGILYMICFILRLCKCKWLILHSSDDSEGNESIQLEQDILMPIAGTGQAYVYTTDRSVLYNNCYGVNFLQMHFLF